jgi:uncharacterized membrane protein YtjA (UPF0391 family)
MIRRHLLRWAVLFLIVSLFAGCFPVDGGAPADERAGFFIGVWHGWIAPISLVLSIFDRSIRVYEITNTGWWYDLGFTMAIISGFGGLSLFRRKSPSDSTRP